MIKSVSLIKMEELKRHIDRITELCRSNEVKNLFAFGSVTGEDFRPESDIDLVVDIEDSDPLSYSDKYFNLKFQLEQLLKRQVDLLEQKAIKNPYLKQQIEKTKVLVYGK
ncbi:nucleotidyltransferase family protein [Negadavirga shengliensis]|uniref:Nucleotidyltransferase family protein n=1 Tax=Negadavirga shengliensis TaxID=1389218 RepID=A0ABV9T744_9BACT